MFWHSFTNQRIRNFWEMNVQLIQGYTFVCNRCVVYLTFHSICDECSVSGSSFVVQICWSIIENFTPLSRTFLSHIWQDFVLCGLLWTLAECTVTTYHYLISQYTGKMIKIVLKRGKECSTYLATARRHRSRLKMTMKNDRWNVAFSRHCGLHQL